MHSFHPSNGLAFKGAVSASKEEVCDMRGVSGRLVEYLESERT